MGRPRKSFVRRFSRNTKPWGSGGWFYLTDDRPDVYVFNDLDSIVAEDEAGDILPTIVLPSDAQKAVSETEAAYDALNTAITTAQVSNDFKVSWGIQYAAEKAFAAGAKSVGFFNTKAVMDQNDRYQAALSDWQKQFVALGGTATAPLPSGQGTGKETLSSMLGGATGLVIAGAALAAILVFGKAVR